MAQYDRFHREVPDKTPVSMPLGYERPEPLESMIARMIRVESVKAQSQGKESFEESDDFDVDDDDIKFTSDHQFTDLEEEQLDNPKPNSKQSRKPARSESQPGAAATASPEQAPVQNPSSSAPGSQPSKAAEQVGEKP